jgi:DnaJ-class molecular chaperone
LPASKAETLKNLHLELVLTPEEARRGGQLQIRIPAQTSCPTCGGRGAVDIYHCYRCMGKGIVFDELPLTVKYPPGISDGYQKALALDDFGIHDIYLTLQFRISRNVN